MRIDDDLKYFEDPAFREILSEYETAREAGTPIYMDADSLTDIAEYYSLVLHDEEHSSEAIALALQLHPDAVDPQIFMARQFMMHGDLDMARKICEVIDEQYHREVIFLRAELLIRQDKIKDAVDLLSDALEVIQEDKDYYLYDSAYILVDYRQFELAMFFAESLEQMAPDWYKTWQLKADVSLGMELFKMALSYIEKMLDVDPFSTESWNWRAEAYCGLADYEEAMNSLEYSLAIDADNERACQLKAWILMQQGNYKEAHQMYLHEIERSQDNEQNFLYDSFCLLEMDQLDASLAAIEKSEEIADGLSTDQAAIYEQHAQILSKLGRVDDALDYVNKAEWETVSETDATEYNLMRARVLAENRRSDDAMMYIEKTDASLEPEQKQDFYFRTAQLFFYTEYYVIAQKFLEELLACSDDAVDQAEYHAFLAYCAMAQHDDEQAMTHLLAARENGQERLRELFAGEFPNVQPAEYYDYYYYRVHHEWPQS